MSESKMSADERGEFRKGTEEDGHTRIRRNGRYVASVEDEYGDWILDALNALAGVEDPAAYLEDLREKAKAFDAMKRLEEICN